MGTTEEEALAKWCPFTRITTFVNRNGDAKALGNRESFAPCGNFNGPASDRCIGSACMAWRRSKREGLGFCGLAGEPF